VKGEGEGGGVVKVLFTHIENRIMKPVKIILKRGGGGEIIAEGVNFIKAHCRHVWRYHHETFVQLSHANKKVQQGKKEHQFPWEDDALSFLYSGRAWHRKQTRR
jgi:hypothetical protein